MADEEFIDLNNPPLIWQDYETNSDLSKDITHVFKISISVYEKIKADYLSVLNTDEITKAARFKNEDDTKRYVIGKYFLRIILASISESKPESIHFSFTGNKKPYVEDIHFNISHSGRFTIITISPMPVGIDIEYINKQFDFAPLLNICFTKSELNNIHNIVDFYTFWTRKEAILKATGEGLTDNLLDIDCVNNIVKRNSTDYRISSKHLDQNHIISLATNLLYDTHKYWNINPSIKQLI